MISSITRAVKIGFLRSGVQLFFFVFFLFSFFSMPPAYFPLRWESTGDQWWYASPIDWAAANGHYDLVRELLRIDSNHLIKLTSLRRIRRLETVWDDEEQFHEVAKCRSRVSRKLLSECEMKRGKNSLIQAGYGGWLMYTAASAGDLGFVQELLQRNPLLVFGEGEYVVTDILYAAARSKNSEVFRLLFDFAVSPKFCSAKNGESEEKTGDLPSVYKWEMMNRAVHAASRGGNLKILKEFLSDSSDVLAYRDIQGSTILHAAAGRGQVEVINYLIAMYDIINSTDHQGNTALHVAAQRGRLAAVEALIAASPSSISLRNNNGETFLHKAISGFQTTAFRRLDRQNDLLKHVVCGKVQNMEDVINSKNNEGRTALHMATIGNIHSDLVQLLMAAKSIDLNARDVYSMTPLDYLKHRPQSPSSDVLIRQLISAGGIFGCRDYTMRRAIALRLKMQGNEISPGTSFRVSDTEILSYTGIENTTSEAAAEPCSERISTSSMETTIYDSTNDIHNSGSSKKPVSVNSAAHKLRSVFHWPQVKNKNCEGRKKSAEEGAAESTKKCSNVEETPTPLRQRFSKLTSPHSNKRTLSVRSNQSSPSAKKKHASGIMHGVMQAIPHISIPRRSRSSSFSKSPLSSPSSVEKPKQMESEKPGSTSSNRLSDEGAPNSTIKHGLHKRFRSQYFCFGASSLGGKRAVLSAC